MSDDASEKTSILSSDTFKGKIKASSEAPPALVVLIGPTGYVGRQFPILSEEMTIGRSVEANIFIDEPSVSRIHAKVFLQNQVVEICDLGSSNKTTLNGKQLNPNEMHAIKNNDQIKMGNVIFKYLEKGNIEAIANQELNDKAQKDALTGAYSKRALLEKGPEAMKRSEFLGEELTALVFDIDHFKKINDKFGHAAGDHVLRELSKIVSTKMVRSNDFFARYGGEEFVILLPALGLPKSHEVAERIRQTIETTKFEFNDQVIPVTISLGIATRVNNETNWEALFQRADAALYQSKQNGRNKVTVA